MGRVYPEYGRVCAGSRTGSPGTSTTPTTSCRRRSCARCRASTGSIPRRPSSAPICSRRSATYSSRGWSRKRVQPMAEVPEPRAAPIEDDPERSTLLHRQQDEVRIANARLPPRQRMVLALRELEDSSYAEIGELVGITENAVAQLIFRARESLRTELRLVQVDPERIPEPCRRTCRCSQPTSTASSRARGATRRSLTSRGARSARRRSEHGGGEAPLPHDPAARRRADEEGAARGAPSSTCTAAGTCPAGARRAHGRQAGRHAAPVVAVGRLALGAGGGLGTAALLDTSEPTRRAPVTTTASPAPCRDAAAFAPVASAFPARNRVGVTIDCRCLPPPRPKLRPAATDHGNHDQPDHDDRCRRPRHETHRRRTDVETSPAPQGDRTRSPSPSRNRSRSRRSRCRRRTRRRRP